MILSALIKKGKLLWDSPTAWPICAREFEGQRVRVTVELERARRSIKANNRYFGLLVPLAADFLSKTRDLPLSKEQTHFLLKSAFLGCDETPLGLVPMDSRTLDSAQFATYCEKVERWLGENGYSTAGEYDGDAA